MMLYQGYREWDPLPLHWGALVDLNGEPTERYDEAARLNQVVLSHEALFLEAQPVRSQIGILVDQRNAIACQGMGAGAYLLEAIKGVYGAYWSQGYGVEFITPELLAEGKGAGYRLLLMPFMMLVTATCAQGWPSAFVWPKSRCARSGRTPAMKRLWPSSRPICAPWMLSSTSPAAPLVRAT